MIKVGITGGIGSGKSHVCDIIARLGYPIYNCDREAKRLMSNEPAIISGLKTLIGKDAYTEHNNLNKTEIAKFLFRNKDNALKVNRIVHPIVKLDFGQWAEKQKSDIVFMESAILFESGFNEIVNKTIAVCAPLETRIQRTIKRDSTTRELVEARIKHQMSDEECKSKTDFHINNDTGSDPTEQIKQIISQLSKSIQKHDATVK